jgi:hypothetical protein
MAAYTGAMMSAEAPRIPLAPYTFPNPNGAGGGGGAGALPGGAPGAVFLGSAGMSPPPGSSTS